MVAQGNVASSDGAPSEGKSATNIVQEVIAGRKVKEGAADSNLTEPMLAQLQVLVALYGSSFSMETACEWLESVSDNALAIRKELMEKAGLR